MRVALSCLLHFLVGCSPATVAQTDDSSDQQRSQEDVWAEFVGGSSDLAEALGYQLLDEGRADEASVWFERAYQLADSVRAVHGVAGRGVLAGQLVRTAWLARGIDAARVEAESMPAEVLDEPYLRLSVCFVRHGELSQLVDVVWRQEAPGEMGASYETYETESGMYERRLTPLGRCLSAI